MKVWYKVSRGFEYKVWIFFDGVHYYSYISHFNHKKKRPKRIFKTFAKITLRGRADLNEQFEI
jgi:hypothetical protein